MAAHFIAMFRPGIITSRDAFYAWLIPPEIAQAEIARDRTGI